MSLAYDECRCMGVGCTIKDSCQRFTDRPMGVLFRIPYISSFIESDGKDCDYFKPVLKTQN